VGLLVVSSTVSSTALRPRDSPGALRRGEGARLAVSRRLRGETRHVRRHGERGELDAAARTGADGRRRARGGDEQSAREFARRRRRRGQGARDRGVSPRGVV